MGKARKNLALALILVIAISSMSLIIVKHASAQTPTPAVPTPYVPQFTLKYVGSSYSQSTNTTDPYTGANVVTVNYYVNNTIELMILNQAFNPNALGNGNTLSLYYSVQSKPHFSDFVSVINNMQAMVPPSSSEYTILNFYFTDDNSSYSEYQPQLPTVPSGGQVDLQVQAIIGYSVTVPYHPFGNPSITMGTTQQFEEVASSGWSNYLTITTANGATANSISVSASPYPTLSPTTTSPNPTLTPAPSTSPTQTSSTTASPSSSPTPTPTVPEFPFIAIPLLFSLLSGAVILSLKSQRRGKQ